MGVNRFHAISPLALVAVSACRFGQTNGPVLSSQTAVGGAVVKGPLNNAFVFLDYNDNGEWDEASEPSARTDQFGEYELFATQNDYTLIAVADDQTVDTSSGAALSGITLKAPSGAEVITPTTTLMEEGNISAEEVATVLGLPDGIDPLSFNPFDVDENDADAVAAALEVEKVSQQIMTAVTSFASAAEGAGASEGDAFTAALGSVVDVVKAKAEKIDHPTAAPADKELDFTNASDLNLIKAEATAKAAELDGIDAAVMTAMADDTTDAIKNVNDKIEAVADLDDAETKNIFSTIQVLKDQVKEAAITQKDGGDGSIAFTDPNAVNNAADNSAPSAITLSGDRLVSADGELVVGTLATIDPDVDDTDFTYTLAGDDADFFDFDANSGELSLKASPNYDDKPYYEITIITKDEGGKKFSETFIIDVVPEFGALAEPDAAEVSDFEVILGQNTLFKNMKDFVELQTIPDGQLVLVEVGDFADGDQSSSSDGEDGPIIAFVSITERGYELRNPATNEYMGGFFTYKTDDLTYTGYEVFVDDMSILAEYEDDLIKYFSPDSEYGTGKLTYTDRDAEYFALAGAKAVDEDGVTVQEMLGFNHYDENMNILGSAGVDVADPVSSYYIEVVGEFEPGVTTNITSTVIEASIAETMQNVLETAGEELLYGEDSGVDDFDGDDQGGEVIDNNNDESIVIANGDVYIVGTNEKLLIVENEGSYSIIPVADGVGSYGLGYDDTRESQISSDLDADGVEAVIGSTPNLDENILLQTNMFNDIIAQSGIFPPDPVNGDVFIVSGSEWVLVVETDVIFTLIPVTDDPEGSGLLVYDDTRTAMRDLSEADVGEFLGDLRVLNENIASNTLEFAAIKGAASTGLADGDIYIVNTDEKILVIQENGSSYTIIPVIDNDILGEPEYDDTRENEIRTNLDAAGVEEVIGANPYLDQNIAPFVNLYNEIVQAFPRPPTFVGEATFADTRVTLKIAEVSELSPNAFIGELSFESGDEAGPVEMSVYEIADYEIMINTDAGIGFLDPGVYALNMDDKQAFIADTDGASYDISNSTAIDFIVDTLLEPTLAAKDVLGTITLEPEQEQTEPNIVFETYFEDGAGFKIEGNNVYLNDGFYFHLDYGDGGPHLVDSSNGNAYQLDTDEYRHEFSIKVNGDVEIAYTGVSVIDATGKYFGHETAEISDVGGYSFTPQDFNSYEYGAVLGTVSVGFDYESIAFALDDGLLELVDNTIKLKDTIYYDVSQQTFELPDLGYHNLSDMSGSYITATEDGINVFSDVIAYSDIVNGGQVMPTPYWAGVPVAKKALPTETNIKALMWGDSDGNTTHWITDPYQDDSEVGDDIIITYSFVEDSSLKFTEGARSSGGPNKSTVWAMNDAQKVSVRQSLDAWSDVVDITFVEVIESEDSDVVGTMRFGFTTYKGEGENVAGWATGPGKGYGNGEIWINTTDDDDGVAQRAKDDLFQKGSSQDYLTLLHEIGHSLGLAHPFDGFLLDGADPDTGKGAPLDNNKYTVMSYTQDDTIGAWIDGEYVWSVSYTPMVLDIAAAQFLYGAQETTNLGDTTYVFGDDLPFAEAIWDADGDNDRLDFSNFTTDLTVSLVPGASSTIPTIIPSGEWTMTDNLGIALGTDIENAVGGSGNDTIVGNDLSNVLNGGLGDDTLTGADGDDIFEFFADFGDDTISDFDVGFDLLRFFDSSDTFIPANLITPQVVGEDLVLAIGDNSLTLEGLSDETFGDSFLDIV